MNLTNKTIRLTVKLDNLEKGTVTYQDFQEMPKIGDFLRNVQFEEHGLKLGKHGHLVAVLKIEEFNNEWCVVAQ